MLLEYSPGDEKSYLFVVTRSELKSFVLPKRPVVEAAARRLYDLLMVGKDEGLVGLTRGFRCAGASSVVASLWDVRDEATSVNESLLRRHVQAWKAAGGCIACGADLALERKAMVCAVLPGRVCSPGRMALSFLQRIQESDEVGAFLIGVNETEMSFVVKDHVSQRRRNAVMEVGRTRGEGPDSRRLELAEIVP